MYGMSTDVDDKEARDVSISNYALPSSLAVESSMRPVCTLAR